MKRVVVHNRTKSVVVGTQIGLADTSWTRLIGLAGRRELGAGAGLLIQPSSGVHTFGMRFPIDVVALDKKLKVVKLWQRLVPFRVTTVSFKTQNVLELPAGTIREAGIDVGDQLEII
jgi:uncharacterized membrane protein (UPF0127 family)